MRGRLLAIARLGFATLTLVALIVLVSELLARGTFDLVNFLSFFTVQSNVFGIVVMLGSAWLAFVGARPSRTWDLVRGANVLYLTVTLVVFNLLLAGADVGVPLAWVDTVLHRIFPIVVILDWLLAPPERLYIREALIWLVYPVVWLVYTLARGAATGWYPYPFLDPVNGGYGSVAAYVVGIFAGGIVLIVLLVVAGNFLGEMQEQRARRRMSA